MYSITQYSRDQAKKLGVTIKPSTNKGKKLDVFDKDGKKLVSIGAMGMSDFPTYMKTKGKEYADERRRLYRIRHGKTMDKVGRPATTRLAFYGEFFFSLLIKWYPRHRVSSGSTASKRTRFQTRDGADES
tara:strand:- start:314 stop:703 length:390 start_codon:yes stop_codon:yes gene_type:complete